MRRGIDIGALSVELSSGLHVWLGSRGAHIFWRDAGLNQPQRRIGPLVIVPDRMGSEAGT